ncbi:MAG TPA: homoserine kinase [Acidobacteriaceae bacterium]|nr:homoserine kinase [Acidobacteriaceae bacterium]
MSGSSTTARVYLRLPATSANLGPGFDTLALALKLHLEIEAEAADSFRIEATGRNAEVCAAIQDNLLVKTYSELQARAGRRAVPLRVRMTNGIPLGMGCGSSAAVRLAAVALASHFGQLAWDDERILAEACRLEGHPDNAAACWLGGFVASAGSGERVQAVSLVPPKEWRAVLAMPEIPLATTASRAVLPAAWPRRDVVENLQRVALMTAAMATGRGELLANAMRDRLHQPYRAEVCPLMGRLLPLAGQGGILGVALSGAGPAVLLLADSEVAAREARERVEHAAAEAEPVEVLVCELESQPVRVQPMG